MSSEDALLGFNKGAMNRGVRRRRLRVQTDEEGAKAIRRANDATGLVRVERGAHRLPLFHRRSEVREGEVAEEEGLGHPARHDRCRSGHLGAD